MPNSLRDSPPPTAQSWAPPKNPLPPHRLARLANALGVSTPMPAIHTPSPMLSPSYNGSSPALDQYRRSPTPSTATTFGFSPATSKYLLHVIPPLHLPHDPDSFDSELTPPPSTASGYHTQFRRGTLVPVHSTLQSQLGAIAKEYALPSTAGLILYLVSQPRSTPSEKEKSFPDELDEPGPRLSEEVWRLLWARVVKTELREEGVSLAPPLLGLGISSALNRSTPYLNAHAYPLPLLSTNSGALTPFTPSPTTPSSASGLPSRFHTKSAPPSSSSPSHSPSEAETPDTSQAASERADSFDLPGLHSDALIPILAKVEFDIDRRKAAWYEPWLRSRRMNHAKRKNSITPSPVDEDGQMERRAPLPLKLRDKDKERRRASSLRREAKRYLPLSESPQSMGSDSEEEVEVDAEVEDDEVQEEEEEDEEDEDADIRAESSSRPTNPNVVPLALSAAELRDVEDDDDDHDEKEADEDEDMREVVSLMNNNRRPSLGVEIPGMQHSVSRKRAPPPTPLVLHPPSTTASPPAAAAPIPAPMPRVVAPVSASDSEDAETPPDSVGRTRLPYLDDREREAHEAELRDQEQDHLSVPRKSMYDPGKRRGEIYEDMDLGFASDDFEVDEDDPNDRRKSQVIMRAQLDEIEKNLAQFSPRILRTDLEASSRSPSPPGSSGSGAFHQYQPMPSSPFMPASNADVFPPTPRLPNHPRGEEEGSSGSEDLSQQAAWPAVPYSSLADRDRAAPSPAAGQTNFLPQLAVNGVSASMPKRFRAGTNTSSRASASSLHSAASSSESELRRREMVEHFPPPPATPPNTSTAAAGYPALTPSIGPKSSLNSPLIPLSPDPFGRYASTAPEVPTQGGKGKGENRTSKSYWEGQVVIPAKEPEVQRKNSNASIGSTTKGSGTGTVSSSRFSTDSMNNVGGPGEGGAGKSQANRATLMSVKGIKNLWRKSRKESVSITRGPPMEALQENAWSPISPPVPGSRPMNPAVPMTTPPPLPPSPNPAAASSGSLPPPPQRPNRPSMEELDLPDVEVDLPPRTPLSAGFPGSPRVVARSGPSPRPSLSERRPSTSTTSSRPSISQERRPSVSQERRPSQDLISRRASPEGMLGVPSRRASPEGQMPPSPHASAHQLGVRPSLEQVPPLPQHPVRRPSDAQMNMPPPPPPGMPPHMSGPPPMLQSTKNAPIIAAMAGPRQTVNDGLLWDQESPYPTRIAPPARAPSVSSSHSHSHSRPPSRPPSPPAPVHYSTPTPPPQNTSPPAQIPPNASPPMQEKERRNSVRKSILKWKSQTNNGAANGAVPAPLTPSAATFRTRKTSLSGSPSQGSPLTLPMDIPPSPKIPDQFISNYVGSHPPPPAPAPASRPNSAAIARRRLSAKMASTSTTDSGSGSSRRQSQHHRPRESTASSAPSEGTHDTHESTNLDTSGFEIVSPKMSGMLSFPYTDLEHDRPVGSVRM